MKGEIFIMNVAELKKFNEVGKLIQDMSSLVKRLAKSSLADEDNEESSSILEDLKNLIVEARSIEEDDFFEFLIK